MATTLYKVYTGTISAGTSIKSINVDLGKDGSRGYIKNTGTAQLTFAYSGDGTTYGDEIPLDGGDVHNFEPNTISMMAGQPQIFTLRITFVSSSTTYKIFIE